MAKLDPTISREDINQIVVDALEQDPDVFRVETNPDGSLEVEATDVKGSKYRVEVTELG